MGGPTLPASHPMARGQLWLLTAPEDRELAGSQLRKHPFLLAPEHGEGGTPRIPEKTVQTEQRAGPTLDIPDEVGVGGGKALAGSAIPKSKHPPARGATPLAPPRCLSPLTPHCSGLSAPGSQVWRNCPPIIDLCFHMDISTAPRGALPAQPPARPRTRGGASGLGRPRPVFERPGTPAPAASVAHAAERVSPHCQGRAVAAEPSRVVRRPWPARLGVCESRPHLPGTAIRPCGGEDTGLGICPCGRPLGAGRSSRPLPRPTQPCLGNVLANLC